MKIIKASYELGYLPEDILERIERVGRLCYKSESLITPESAVKFVKQLITRKHEAMLEHVSFSVKFICDRGVSHEIVRHRLFSFAQESTRYCNYSKDKFGNELTFIAPCFWPVDSVNYSEWYRAMDQAEDCYLNLISADVKPEEARSVLPNSLKTEIMVTGNLRQWRTFLKLRVALDAHSQIRELAQPLLYELKSTIPVVFDDIFC